MVTALKRVKIGNKTYFIDKRLNELRNVKNPSDVEKMEGSEDFYLKTFGELKSNIVDKSISKQRKKYI